jgi:hypothetical protein
MLPWLKNLPNYSPGFGMGPMGGKVFVKQSWQRINIVVNKQDHITAGF